MKGNRASARQPSERPPAPQRVLIVDDHPLVRRALVALVREVADLTICGEAADVAGAVAAMESTRPDVVVIDISLESSNGLDLIQRIKAKYPDTKMLVLSMHDESFYAERALRAGAMGYVQKEAAPEKVIDAIRQVLAGHLYLSPQMTERFLHQMVQGSTLELPAIARLSNRELQVFERIGDGLTTREIAKKLRLSMKTIETHRDHIRHKLNLKNATELTRRAVEWRLEDR